MSMIQNIRENNRWNTWTYWLALLLALIKFNIKMTCLNSHWL